MVHSCKGRHRDRGMEIVGLDNGCLLVHDGLLDLPIRGILITADKVHSDHICRHERLLRYRVPHLILLNRCAEVVGVPPDLARLVPLKVLVKLVRRLHEEFGVTICAIYVVCSCTLHRGISLSHDRSNGFEALRGH